MNLTGVILAGGLSSRMGTSKALLPMEGRHLIDRTLEVVGELRPLLDRIVVSGTVPLMYTIPDIEPLRGPVGGIESVARALLGDSNPADGILIVPVDLPLLTSKALRPLVDFFLTGRPRAAFFEGLWLPAVFELTDSLLGHCRLNESVHSLLKALSAESIPLAEASAFTNTNTPAEWKSVTGRVK